MDPCFAQVSSDARSYVTRHVAGETLVVPVTGRMADPSLYGARVLEAWRAWRALPRYRILQRADLMAQMLYLVLTVVLSGTATARTANSSLGTVPKVSAPEESPVVPETVVVPVPVVPCPAVPPPPPPAGPVGPVAEPAPVGPVAPPAPAVLCMR